MKRGRAFLVFAVLLAVLPAAALIGRGDPAPPVQENVPLADGLSAGFTVLDEGTGQVLQLTEEEYILGALLCEMPASWEEEALKAQAVAIRSYALFVKAQQQANPDPSLEGAHFAVNTKTLTGYMSEADAAKHFGDYFNVYYNKAKAVVEEISGYALLWEGTPICACYHAISPGRTEASENVFASALPYLVPADSSFDAAAEGYLSAAAFPPYDLADILAGAKEGFSVSGEPSEWLGQRETTLSGTVVRQDICGVSFSGTQLRELLGLRSAAFDIRYDEEHGQFLFTVRGYGHGVGMSQNGANALAKQGKTFEEILAHYYKGAQLAEHAAA